jgi:predicted enzyme related to lactoylglutathione lyase
LPNTAEDRAARCAAAGGQVMGPVIDIPQGRFQYAADLDGNSIALFEMKTH